MNSTTLIESLEVKKSIDKLEIIDFCKGLGISLIFLNHFFHHGNNIFNKLGWEGVHLFIVLSGFGLTFSYLTKGMKIPSFRKWLAQRLKRLMPTYWLTCVVGFIFVLIVKINNFPDKLININTSSWYIKVFLHDLFVVQNFNFQTIFSPPTGHLWFIPFIIGFYLFFPLFIKTFNKIGYMKFFLLSLTVEFLYRAISIYFLDGTPVSFREKLALDHLANQFPFQQGAPFGFFPSRMGEFSLGMIGAYLLFENRAKIERLVLGIYSFIFGSFIFLIGNLLRDVLWGWILSDFCIALGLILVSLNLASFARNKLSFMFNLFVNMGLSSYYIYLIHMIIIQAVLLLARVSFALHMGDRVGFIEIILLGSVCVFTWLSAKLMKSFDAKISHFWMPTSQRM